MIDKSRKPDLMGVFDGEELFQPYETDDGWLVVLPGEEDGRRQKYGKTLVAETQVEISLTSEADLENCIRELEESDRRIRELSGRPPWDWQKVMVKGLQVRFGVAWYDRDFFETRKTAFSDPVHQRMYARFGATLDNFKVEHHLVENAASGLEGDS